jgi:hypothetical protein
MKIIKLTDKEHGMICTILGALMSQIDEEVVNLTPADATDEETDRVCSEARVALAKLF